MFACKIICNFDAVELGIIIHMHTFIIVIESMTVKSDVERGHMNLRV